MTDAAAEPDAVELSPIVEGLRPLAVPIDGLRTMAGNPHHADTEALMRSWAKFGQRRPLVARRDAKNKLTGEVIAGNHGLEVARRLGWTQVAVLWVEDDDATAKAWAVTDNHTGTLGYEDPKLLSELLLSLRVSDAELFASTAYSNADLIELLTELEGEEESGGDADRAMRDGGEQMIGASWAVIIECDDEPTQMDLLDRLVSEGYQCRALIS
jgi:ParB-like chromosome segregation protein Spo0J